MLIKLPLLKIKDGYKPDGYLIRGDFHDLFILGKDGGLHYLNIQGMVGTEYGGLKFQTTYSELWQEEIFDKVNFLELMDLDAKRLEVENDPKYIHLKDRIKKYFKAAERKFEEETLATIKEATKGLGYWEEDETYTRRNKRKRN